MKNTKIEILDDKQKSNSISSFSKDDRKTISYLTNQNIKFIAYITFIVFISINSLNIILVFFSNDSIVGLNIIIPGSQILTISYFFFGFLFVSPAITGYILIKNYRIINQINKKKLENILEPLPKNIQEKITENLKALKIKNLKKLKRE